MANGTRIIAAILALFTLTISATSLDYAGHQVWRIVPSSNYVLSALQQIGQIYELDFWKDPIMIGRAVDFRVPPSQQKKVKQALKNYGITDYTIFITDAQQLINQQIEPSHKANLNQRSTAKTVASFDYSVYHTLEEIYEWIDMVADEYSQFVTKSQIGVSYEGRPLYVLKFNKTEDGATDRPIIFIDSLLHSREWITTASLMYIFKEMLQNPSYQHMLDDVDWYFVPMINVDGYVETWTRDRLWRKTLSRGASFRCKGVDGNRNFDSHWSEPGASPNPCSITYYGPTAQSESEVRNLANYVLGLGFGKISAFLTTHSYSQLILYPYGYAPVLAPNNQEMNETGRIMSEAIQAVHGKYYEWGPSATGIYVTSGATEDWAYDAAGARVSYTYELRDTGTYGFLLPPDQILPNGEEYLAGIEALKKHIIENF